MHSVAPYGVYYQPVVSYQPVLVPLGGGGGIGYGGGGIGYGGGYGGGYSGGNPGSGFGHRRSLRSADSCRVSVLDVLLHTPSLSTLASLASQLSPALQQELATPANSSGRAFTLFAPCAPRPSHAPNRRRRAIR